MIMTRVVLAGVLALASCSSSGPATAAPASTSKVPAGKDPAAARRLIAAGAVVLDVRTPEEFGGGHLAAAVNIPVADLHDRLAEVDRLVGPDKTKPVVVYCASGARAADAQRQLEIAGYTQVVNGGGYDKLK